MKRIGLALVATLVAIAGCTSHRTRTRTEPAPSTASRSPSPSAQPPGKRCAEITATLSELSGVSWRLRDDQRIDDREVAKPGTRQCEAEASSSDHSPPALLSITLYRPRPTYDTPEVLRSQAEKRAKPCTTELTAPPPGVTYAVSCLEQLNSETTRTTTTLLGPVGWVSVGVTGQHKETTAATNQAKSFVQNASRQGAVYTFTCI